MLLGKYFSWLHQKYCIKAHKNGKESATHVTLSLTIDLDNYLKSQILISNSIIDSSHKFLWIEIFHLRKSKPFLS